MAVTTDITKKSMPAFSPGQGATAIIEERIAWCDIEARLAELFGATYVAGMGFTSTAVERHPDWDWLVADSTAVAPAMPDDTARAADDPDYHCDAVLTITYRGACLNIWYGEPGTTDVPTSGTYLVHRVQGGGEVMTIPGARFTWSDETTPVSPDIEAGKFIVIRTHRFTWYGVTHPPWSVIKTVDGTVNATAYMGADPETLLFVDYSAERSFDADGEPVYTLDYTILEKRNRSTDTSNENIYGWNHFYRAGASPEWEKICHKPAGQDAQPVYTETDWTNLFRVA